MFAFIAAHHILFLLMGATGVWSLLLAYYSIVIVGGSEIAVIERRWFGRKMPQGRVVAMGNEVGIQARDRKSTRLNSSHSDRSRMPSSA